MATPLKPGVGRALFSRMAAEGQRRGRLALEPLALVIERQAKLNMGYASHKYGTPTPAVPGKGPGLISGTGRRSITHMPITRISVGWHTRVGTATGFYPTYRSRRGSRTSKTPANVYLEILEVKGSRAGNRYPFLEPAFRFGVDIAGPVIFREAYGSGWSRLV